MINQAIKMWHTLITPILATYDNHHGLKSHCECLKLRMNYQPRCLVMQDLGYIQVMGLNKLLQEYNLLQDLHGGNGILSGGPKHAVEQFGHDVLLQALVHKKTHQGV